MLLPYWSPILLKKSSSIFGNLSDTSAPRQQISQFSKPGSTFGWSKWSFILELITFILQVSRVPRMKVMCQNWTFIPSSDDDVTRAYYLTAWTWAPVLLYAAQYYIGTGSFIIVVAIICWFNSIEYQCSVQMLSVSYVNFARYATNTWGWFAMLFQASCSLLYCVLRVVWYRSNMMKGRFRMRIFW
jgi:hypothetical protein